MCKIKLIRILLCTICNHMSTYIKKKKFERADYIWTTGSLSPRFHQSKIFCVALSSVSTSLRDDWQLPAIKSGRWVQDNREWTHLQFKNKYSYTTGVPFLTAVGLENFHIAWKHYPPFALHNFNRLSYVSSTLWKPPPCQPLLPYRDTNQKSHGAKSGLEGVGEKKKKRRKFCSSR